MFIVLDESYNLKDRTKLQFISINGFAVLDIKGLMKRWKEHRRPFVARRRRIHATDSVFNELRVKALQLVARPDVTLLTAFQVIQEIPFGREKKYFVKGKLDFEKVYFDLLITLFWELRLGEYKSVKIIIDSRKHKGGILGKKRFQKEVISFLKKQYADVRIKFKMQPSSTDISLELADFVSNIFYRAYINKDESFFDNLKFKTIQIKNPL